jgi:general secretion pathway protein G
MKSIISCKWAGILSVVWLCAGFFALRLSDFHSESPLLRFLVIYCAWWGVAVLLAVAGMRSRRVPSVVAALATIILLISFLWMTAPRGHSHGAPIAAAMTQIATFRTALDAFRTDNGFYPTGKNALQGLEERPAGATNWRGPYLSSDAVPKDPWGHDYIYESRGRHNTNSYDISSAGPPRGHVPIANWDREGLKP